MKKRGLFLLVFLIFSSVLFSQNYFDDIMPPAMQGTRFLVKSDSSVNAVAWSHNGKRYASAWGSSILVWDSTKNTIAAIISNVIDETTNPFLTIKSIQFNEDDTHILCVTDGNKVILHDLSGKTDALIVSGIGNSISDACFLGSGVRFVAALDEKSLYECNQDETNPEEFSITKRLDFDSKILSITTDGEGEYIIVATQDDKAILIDANDWKILDETQTYNQTHIKPKFSNKHKHFLYAKAQDHIYIQNTEDDRFNMDLQNEYFSYVAEFSNNESFLVLAADNGRLHLFDLRVVKQERMFELLEDDDQVISLAWSSDDRFFVFGTKKGYLYRIDKFGRSYKIDSTEDEIYGESKESDFVVGPKKKGSSGGKAKSGSTPTISASKSEIIKNYDAPDNFSTLMLEYATLNTDNYIGSFAISTTYRNFNLFPIHLGGGVEVKMGVPSSDFAYKYFDSEGNTIENPYLYEAGIFIVTGLSFSIAKKKGAVFVDVAAGPNIKKFFNNDFKNGYVSKNFYGAFCDLTAGIKYKKFCSQIGMGFDSNYRSQMKFKIGIAF